MVGLASTFDGTLAKYGASSGISTIGAPVPLMVERVKQWLASGLEVRIFTARVSDPDRRTRAKVIADIEDWCLQHLGQKLPVTNVKDYSMTRLYDDRAVQVEVNTGRIIGPEDSGVIELVKI
jgi:hypothetical protein